MTILAIIVLILAALWQLVDCRDAMACRGKISFSIIGWGALIALVIFIL